MSDAQGEGVGAPGVEHQGRPELTISEAALACGVHRDVIKRRLAGDAFPNGRRDEGRPGSPWLIPIGDLLAAGLKLTGPPQEPVEDAGEVDRLTAELAAVRAERDALRVDVATWRTRAEERDRAISLAESALRMLPAAQTPSDGRRGRWGLFMRRT